MTEEPDIGGSGEEGESQGESQGDIIDCLTDDNGHWIWTRDENYAEYLAATFGSFAVLFDSLTRPPEHWFKKTPPDKLWIKCIDGTTGVKGIEIEMPVSFETPEGTVTISGEEWTGKTSVYLKDNRWVMEIRGLSASGQRCYTLKWKEIIDGEYHDVFEDCLLNVSGRRIYKKYPFYRIQNDTGYQLTLVTYNESDFLMIIAAMSKDIEVCETLVEVHCGDVTVEQAYLYLPDGKQLCIPEINVFSKYVLELSDFS